MSAERDLILALLRRLVAEGAIDAGDIAAIADDVAARGGDDHSEVAHLARLTVIEAATAGQRPVDLAAERRRKEMIARTRMIEEGQQPVE